MRDEPMVRKAMQAVEGALAALPDGVAGDGVRGAWSRLVETLALGPPRATRTCPSCGATGMREATRCGACWSALVPPADREATP